MPTGIQRQRRKGWRKRPGSVIVDRTSRWGNPFRVGGLVEEPGPYGGPARPYTGALPPGTYTRRDALDYGETTYVIRVVRDREDATNLFRAYVDHHTDEWPPEGIRHALGGRDLVCFCPLPRPGEPDHCHRSVLLLIANPREASHE
jgi:hypothetical protein